MSRPTRKRKPKPTLAQVAIKRDIITPEYAAKVGSTLEPVGVDRMLGRHETTVRVRSSPLERLYHRKPSAIPLAEFTAGTRLYELFRATGLDPMKATDWTRPVVDTSHRPDSPAYDRARDAYAKAIQCLDNPMTLAVVTSIVIREQDVLRIEPVRRGEGTSSYYSRGSKAHGAETLTILRLGLHDLAVHFGYLKRKR